MLQLDQVSLRQGDFTLEANLAIAQGAKVAVMGASGSGKSTLLSLIAGFLWPDAGRVLWGTDDISRRPVGARPLSVLFQDGNLFPHLTAFENVAIGIEPSLKLHWEDQARVAEALDRVGLKGLGARKPATLSGGQQGRVALARLLLLDKPLTLLDEPFAALDPALRKDMLDLLAELAAEKSLSLIMVSHDLRDAIRLCDHIWLLDNGRVVLNKALQAAIDRNEPSLAPWM